MIFGAWWAIGLLDVVRWHCKKYLRIPIWNWSFLKFSKQLEFLIFFKIKTTNEACDPTFLSVKLILTISKILSSYNPFPYALLAYAGVCAVSVDILRECQKMDFVAWAYVECRLRTLFWRKLSMFCRFQKVVGKILI